MNNRAIWFALVLLLVFIGVWGLGLWIGGCSQPLEEIIDMNTTTSTNANINTSSTTTGQTTTTGIGINMISGTISWDWTGYVTAERWGTLQVIVWPNENFDSTNAVTYEMHAIWLGQTSAEYNFEGLLNGNYYIVAALFYNRSVSPFPDSVSGDKIGQYSDGQTPIVFGGDTHAEKIPYTGGYISGKDIFLSGNM